MESDRGTRPKHVNTIRDNSPDSLYGSILAIEAVVSALVAEVLNQSATPAASLRALRQRIETTQDWQTATKYGTGATLIADGIRDSLDAIFNRSEQMLDQGIHKQ